MLDKGLIQYIPHIHKCSMGITDLNHSTKKSRSFFDATFSQKYLSNPINDMTTSDTETHIIFPTVSIDTLQRIWNILITY